MKYLFKLAFKNIMRAKRRTILTFMMLSFAVMIYLMMDSMFAGFDAASFRNYIDFETGHFKVRNTHFDEDTPYDVENYIKNTSSIEEKLNKMKFITGYTSRINFLSSIDNGIDSTPVIAVGIDPVNDNKVFSLKKYITEGSLEKEGILIGKALARDMKIGTGEIVYLTFRDKDGMFTSIELLITGLFQTASPKTNNSTVFINLDEAKLYMGALGATEVSVKTDNYTKTEEYSKTIKTALRGFTVKNWKEMSTDFAALMETKRKGTNYFLLFIIIIALVGIINTLLMSVYEKKQEIGTLMALGMDQSEVKNMFVFEGLIIGILGTLIGFLIGTAVNFYFIYMGIDYGSWLGEEGMGFNVMGRVKSAWVFSSYIKSFFLVVAASVLSSYYPAKKVMKMVPAECLRTVQ